MNRSGYTDDIDDPLQLGRWRAQVKSAIRGKRGQAFLRELAAAMDAMPEKVLIADELINDEGDCCAIGVLCKSRGIDVSQVDSDNPKQVGDAVGIAHQLAAEIEYENDEFSGEFRKVSVSKGESWQGFRWDRIEESPEQRWLRMRKWVESKITK